MSFFRSFIMGGYECADHINRSGTRINLLRETEHDVRVREDYALLAEAGIKTVREGICWSAVESRPGRFDFGEVLHRIEAAREYGIQQVWDLVHFGYPDGLYPTHPHFCDRFTALCEAFAVFHKAHSTERLFVVPINEISFLAWHSGDVRGTVPFAVNSGWDMKYHLCKAAILGIRALRAADPDCRIVLVEPLVKIHQSDFCSDEHLYDINSHQFQAMDMILGRMCPELGGSELLADVLGFNYYWNCQWYESFGPLAWPDQQQERTPLSRLLKKAYARYGKPIFLSETGHFGSGRIEWLDEVMAECTAAVAKGVDFHGICLYPVTDRPDWDDLSGYCQCGIWDLDVLKNRIVHQPYLDRILELQTVAYKVVT
ncbi:hypothetical protein HUK80_06080 [Flavobacterium sp. MAH-1]|uniref:Beta-glucosidase/6-phospho-beta-glucosidase/beta-galactosidase n=1 Tax=Flavobacterium agri TaxID=2743471 RepID=A0A7Y8Y100_9FLAO|nr:hypothetical protein [Flavobacterium agri]NUY80457.1 hypothetical protein [Flavobacterium agri]NYA70482.1 hypothetical protein [Flavobacterium agri]